MASGPGVSYSEHYTQARQKHSDAEMFANPYATWKSLQDKEFESYMYLLKQHRVHAIKGGWNPTLSFNEKALVKMARCMEILSEAHEAGWHAEHVCSLG